MTRRKVQLIGVPTDSNSSFMRGPASAPAFVREALLSDHGNPAAENGLELFRDIPLDVGGDLMLSETPDDDTVIADAITRAAESGMLPFAIGGDHSITAPIVRALARLHGPLNILHIDAHPDLYNDMQSNPRSHASPFARIMERGDAMRLVQIGIRTLNDHQRQQAERFGVEIIEARHFDRAAVPELASPLYISIDLDGLDPSAAPGVSHHEPGGLTVRELVSILARQHARLVGADVVELNPQRDVNGMTAIVAAKLVKEICSLSGAA